MAKKHISLVEKKGPVNKAQTGNLRPQHDVGSGETGTLIRLQRQIGNQILQRQLAQKTHPVGDARLNTREITRAKGNEAATVIWRNQRGGIVEILEIDTNENLDRFLAGEVTAEQLVKQKHALFAIPLIRKRFHAAPTKPAISPPQAVRLSALAESFKEELQIALNAREAKRISEVWEEVKKSKLEIGELEMLKKMISPALRELCSQNLNRAIKAGNIKEILQSVEPAMRVELDDAIIDPLMKRITAEVAKISGQEIDKAIKAGDIKGALQSAETAMLIGVDAEISGQFMERISEGAWRTSIEALTAAEKNGDVAGVLKVLVHVQMGLVRGEHASSLRQRAISVLRKLGRSDLAEGF